MFEVCFKRCSQVRKRAGIVNKNNFLYQIQGGFVKNAVETSEQQRILLIVEWHNDANTWQKVGVPRGPTLAMTRLWYWAKQR